MCGIFAYIGGQNAVQLSMAGLKRLEYRGYDSAGVAGLHHGQLVLCKEVGKVSALEASVEKMGLDVDMAIAHTRWATHGRVVQENAHPHLDQGKTCAIVHNGIIENHESLRERLKEEGVQFRSETDTEVLVQLIGSFYHGDILEAVQQAMPMVEGSYAVAIIHKDHPDCIVATANQSPLAIGIGQDEAFVASDTGAFLTHTREVVYLQDGEVAKITADGFEVFDETSAQVMKKKELLDKEVQDASKGGYEHYTLKEIFEQPQTIRNALLARYMEDYGTATLEGLNLDVNHLLKVERILILACGTSWHAGAIAAYMLEDLARIPVQVEISSEFRYKNPVVCDNSLVLAISQSGETADTIAAMRELKAKGANIVGICNVARSQLAREADALFLLRAGAEIGVCSTKAFSSQLVILSLFTLLMARMRHMSKKEGQEFIEGLKSLPSQVEKILEKAPQIEEIACRYAKFDNFFYVGRNSLYPAALEGALKLKEVAYVNANGYAAGELKHGPIALINEDCPTVAFCANALTYDKLLSNLMEIKARGGPIIAIATMGSRGLSTVADEVIWIPTASDVFSPLTSTVVAQLFAYYVAKERGCEIDQPRNLAKSVTVE